MLVVRLAGHVVVHVAVRGTEQVQLTRGVTHGAGLSIEMWMRALSMKVMMWMVW